MSRYVTVSAVSLSPIYDFEENRKRVKKLKPDITARLNLDYAVCYLGSVLLTSETAEFSIHRVLREFEIEELDDYFARSVRHRKQHME